VEWSAETDPNAVINDRIYADQGLPFPEAKPIPAYISVWETGAEPETNHLGLPPGSEWKETVDKRIIT